MVLLEDGHKLKRGKRPADVELCDGAVQAAEDLGEVAADKEGLVLLDALVGVYCLDQHLWRSDQNVECLLLQRDGGMKLYVHGRMLGALET